MKYLIAIAAFLAVCWAGYTVYTNWGSSDYKKELEDLHKENSRLKSERESLDKSIDSLQHNFAILKTEEAKLNSLIAEKDREIAKDLAAAKRSQAELSSLKTQIAQTRKEIARIKSNPPNRTGEDLLNSLKIKTERK